MANIRVNESGNYTANIRKKSVNITQTFKRKEDAELWVIYKEDLIEQINAFDPPLQEIITLQDAIELKIKDAIEKGVVELENFKHLPIIFEKFCSLNLNKILYDDLLAYFDELMKIPVRQGGSKNDKSSGSIRLPSIHTTFRKFGYLSTVFQLVKEQGVNIDNPALKVCQFIRPKLKNKKKENDG